MLFFAIKKVVYIYQVIEIRKNDNIKLWYFIY
jgi:hypothetical protein